ncbi:MAG: beta-glucosidase, partial [Bacilli bacterium]|nr:beta-glucosidase [Bacilli bacterium]
VNLHRSPFSGRNTEYYSEDPLLNGKFAATVIKGVQEKGVYANVKHFALNDQETNRGGVATWADEQAVRELYLKPFEFAVKEGKSRGLMTSFNRIGTVWTGGCYELVTKILRNEWGFVGSVICDFNTSNQKFMDSKQMLYAGGDINLAGDKQVWLSTTGRRPTVSATNPKDVNLLRRSAHNNLYAIVNSNAMKVAIDHYLPPVWKVALNAVEIGIGGAVVVWGFFAIFTALRKKDEIAKA